MKIQDVFETGREEEKNALMQRHNELMKELKDKQERKVEKKDDNNPVKSGSEDLDRDANIYLESLDRVKAASIAARIARGEEVAKAQRDYLNAKYPDLLSDAKKVNHKINNIIKKIESSDSKAEAEEILQKSDPQIITQPYKNEQTTVFDKAVEIISKKN